METKGWVRQQMVEPGYGWYSGIEDDEVVSLTSSIQQPASTEGDVGARQIFCRRRAANAGSRSDWIAAYQRCMAGG
jgi:hypothetical protein